MVPLLHILLLLACIAGAVFTVYRLLALLATAVAGPRAHLTPYVIVRADATPVDASALAIAILGAGFRVDERRRTLVVTRAQGHEQAIVRLPWSRAVGAALGVEASDRDLVLGLMTALSAVLGTLHLRTAELGHVVVSAPTSAASPDAPRAWVVARRPRVASHYALDESGRRLGRR
jgi:hypothetical protein